MKPTLKEWLARKSRIGPKPRKPLRKVSQKRAKQLAVYRRARVQFLREFPVCEACLVIDPDSIPRKATDIHHMAGRIGEKLNDMNDWLPVCRDCHHWIHDNPSAARAAFLLK